MISCKKAIAALTLCLGLVAGAVPAQAYFNSPLAENPNYRPVNFGMGYEVYIDLGSLETQPSKSGDWVFTVNMFNSKEDSGLIEGTYPLTYKIDRGRQAWVYDQPTHDWQAIPMNKQLKHRQLADYAAVNLCYKLKNGKYLNDFNGYASAMERYYKGDPAAPVTGAKL